MTWTKLDEDFDDDIADAGLSKDGRWAHLQGLLYCMRRLTDGWLPERVVDKFDIDDPDACGQELCDAGFWQRRPGGYQVIHHMQWQPTRQDVEDRKAANAARQSKARRKKADEARRKAESDLEETSPVTRDGTRDKTRDSQSVTTGRVGTERSGPGVRSEPPPSVPRQTTAPATVPSSMPALALAVPSGEGRLYGWDACPSCGSVEPCDCEA